MATQELQQRSSTVTQQPANKLAQAKEGVAQGSGQYANLTKMQKW
jgi:hypothetical protein